MNTLADLYKEAARVARMIEPYPELSMLDVVRVCNGRINTYFLYFAQPPNHYTFALAIVEGKPVFAGDKFWNNAAKHIAQATDGEYLYCDQGGGHIVSKCSWNPPKPKTVMIELTREDAEYWIECGRANHWDNSTAYVAASKNFFHAIKKALEK